MKRAKKTLALILAIAMCFSLISTMAFADEPHYKYLAIGDSTSQGYFTPGYSDAGQAGNLQPVSNEDDSEFKNDGYVYKMYDYLKEYATSKGMQMDRDDFYQYTLCGMRPNELYAILDPEGSAATMDKFAAQRTGWYYGGYQGSFQTIEGVPYADSLASLSEVFNAAVADADVITYDLGMNCFGNYLIDRLMALLSPDYSKFENDTFELMYNQIDNEATKAACATLEKTLKSAIAKLLEAAPELLADKPDMADKLLDFALYCYSSFCVYFDKTVDIIYNSNPDVNLIVVAQYNGMKDLKFIVGEGDEKITLDFGKLMGVVFSAMNTHITGVSKHADWYKFADCSSVTTFTDELASGKMLDSTFDVFQTQARDDMTAFFSAEGAAGFGFTDVTDDMIRTNLGKIAACPEVELQPVVEALTNVGIPDKVMLALAPCFKALYDFDNATSADISVAYIFFILKAGRGFASHPNIVGCQEKFEAVKHAFESPLKANAYAAKNVVEGITYGTGAVWTAIKTPVLKAIYGAFNNIGIDLEGFFATIRQGLEKVQDFVMIFMPILNLAKK